MSTNEFTSQESSLWTPPKRNLIVSPHEVRGIAGDYRAPIDRYFRILYPNESVCECEGYTVGQGTETCWRIEMLCPKCNRNIQLDSTRKGLHVTQEGVESDVFRCSWPAEFGGVCAFRGALELPKKREDKQVYLEDGRLVSIDAVLRLS
jgi:hypothetical protein